MAINITDTVRELVVAIPEATRVFERLGIDYCCGGSRSLADACQTAQVPLEKVVQWLEEVEQSAQANAGSRDWQAESLTRLASYIVDTHHVFTQQELNRLAQLLTKVCSVHGENHPELLRLQTLFADLAQELTPHMLKEEQVLFPYITRMEEAVNQGRPVPPPFFGTVRNPVRMMMMEHDGAGEVLREIRRVTNNLTTPPDACISYQTLYQALAALEEDLHQHIHLENNILFPHAIEMESAAEGGLPSSFGESHEHRCFGH
jgi:regulator of cell morphogenesis and NO signaling